MNGGMKAITKVLPGLLLVVSTALVPATSAASVITRTDGNDTPGPLDLGKVRIAHISRTTDSILVQQISPFTNRDIDGKQGYFVLNFSMDGGSHVQWVGYVFFTEGKLRGVLVNGGSGSVTATLRVARAGGQGVVVKGATMRSAAGAIASSRSACGVGLHARDDVSTRCRTAVRSCTTSWHRR